MESERHVVLVCGGRDYNQQNSIFWDLDKIHAASLRSRITATKHSPCQNGWRERRDLFDMTKKDEMAEKIDVHKVIEEANAPALYVPDSGVIDKKWKVLLEVAREMNQTPGTPFRADVLSVALERVSRAAVSTEGPSDTSKAARLRKDLSTALTEVCRLMNVGIEEGFDAGFNLEKSALSGKMIISKITIQRVYG